MDNHKIKLPSNKSFGALFSAVFLIVAIYFYINKNNSFSLIFGNFSIIFTIITLTKPDILSLFNKMWMRFGLFLGKIINPIVMGFIFFFIFTPVSFLMRLFGRDELSLQFKKKSSYWINRTEYNQSNSYNHQF
tara:strand:- start:266 stop:664 length:399 start_codon:yes stop_codon:yes gene_type:complete